MRDSSPKGVWLDNADLISVVERGDRSKFIIAVKSDHGRKLVYFLRGNSEVMSIPFSSFRPRMGSEWVAVKKRVDCSNSELPDFHRLGITDSGLTLTLGNYEASSDAVIEEAMAVEGSWSEVMLQLFTNPAAAQDIKVRVTFAVSADGSWAAHGWSEPGKDVDIGHVSDVIVEMMQEHPIVKWYTLEATVPAPVASLADDVVGVARPVDGRE